MATTFIVRTDKTKGLVPLHVRVQYSTPKLNLRLKTPLNVPIEKWTLSRSGAAWANYAQSESGSFVVSKMEQIRNAVDSRIRDGKSMTAKDLEKICNEIIYREERDE